MFELSGLWLVGVILAVFAYSARAVYEELDQDMPYIVWPTLIMQWIGYSLLAYSLIANGASPWLVGVATLLLVTESVLETWYLLETPLLENMVLLLGVMGFAAAIILPSNQSLGGVAVTVLGAIAIILGKSVILPAEQDRRLSSGPGMSLLILGWLMLGLSVAPAGTLAFPGTVSMDSPLPTLAPSTTPMASPLPTVASPSRMFSL